ncbi:hypothetical protein DV736_g6253, partial [Chaetothyriales sp. CBS 134916]
MSEQSLQKIQVPTCVSFILLHNTNNITTEQEPNNIGPNEASSTLQKHRPTELLNDSTKFMTQSSTNMPKSITFSSSTSTNPAQSIYTRPQKRPKMSITQTYFLAHSARGKLSKEAARPDHDLRLLVGHANMLDSLMLDLANAEQEQERWFNRSLSESDEEEEESVDHIETILEEKENEEKEADEEITQITEAELESEDDDDNILTRTTSHHSPPALSQDSDSESEDDENMPLSPPQPIMEILSEKQRQSIATTSYYDTNDTSMLAPVESETFEQEGFYLPSRQQPIQIAAY